MKLKILIVGVNETQLNNEKEFLNCIRNFSEGTIVELTFTKKFISKNKLNYNII